MKRHRKAIVFFLLLGVSILILARCTNQSPRSNDPRGTAYAGSAACRQCHQQVYDAYLPSMHAQSTQAASKTTVQGSFAAGQNDCPFGADTRVQLQSRDSGLFQAAMVKGKEVEAHRMDIVFGGKHAQTFLYWSGDRTYELPVSYYRSLNGWGTSPGFSATEANFKRFIGANCFECHSSYIKSQLNASTAGIQEVLDRSTIIYGIDCERCHGPGAQHIQFHTDHPGEKQARYMTRFASLTRQQKLDVCAVCHSGNDKVEERSTFGFRPGDTLSHFFAVWASENDTTARFDVHGNQYRLLMQSRCFLQSKTMDCGTCHSPHTNAGNDVRTYSAVCQDCHRNVQHDAARLGTTAAVIQSNCIDCHMPLQPSRAITFYEAGSPLRSAYMLRTHRIAVYR